MSAARAEAGGEAGGIPLRGASGPVVVIGLGNPLLADDGVGLAALERLEREWELDPGVELVDGGTWGLTLLPWMEDAGRLLLVDAIEGDAAPGEVVVLERDELPAFLAAKVSPHQVGLQDLFALLTLRGTLPEQTVAVGLRPADLTGTGGLSPEVRAGLDALVERVVERLRAWGVGCRRRGDGGGGGTEGAGQGPEAGIRAPGLPRPGEA